MLKIPDQFLNIPYNGACYPGAQGITDMSKGANCQLFAYKLLEHFGKTPPYLRSSELWDDTTHTQKVQELKELDILLWNKTSQAWGAHVGVYIGDNQIIHLSKAEGFPVIWGIEDFKAHSQYAVYIGAKRVF